MGLGDHRNNYEEGGPSNEAIYLEFRNERCNHFLAFTTRLLTISRRLKS